MEAGKQVEFPVLKVRMVEIAKVTPNEYNPNKVAERELNLLIRSIAEDGVTQPIVTFYNEAEDRYEIVDGFHRYKVLRDHFECDEVPVVVIEKSITERMASTIRHNRARGKHDVELQGELVKRLVREGESDARICVQLGMTQEELVRLKQVVGIARLFANREYSKSWALQ